MEDNTITTENPCTTEAILPETCVHRDSTELDHLPDAIIVTNTTNRPKKTPMNPTPLYISASFSLCSNNSSIL